MDNCDNVWRVGSAQRFMRAFLSSALVTQLAEYPDYALCIGIDGQRRHDLKYQIDDLATVGYIKLSSKLHGCVGRAQFLKRTFQRFF